MGAAGFIGSMVEADEGLLLLRGTLPPDAGARVREHLADLVAAGVRHVRVDARGAAGVGDEVLRALATTQRRLTVRRGMVSIVGVRVASPAPVTAAPVAA